jgi:phytoene dehydrogenase-like protein
MSTPARRSYDAVIIGSGPNGLAAAITLARAGRSTLVVEAEEVPGGGARSLELTQPGFVHDLCSAIHPLGVISPFFRSLPLSDHGLVWIHPPAALAHPLEDGQVALLEQSVDVTAQRLGVDAAAYRRLMAPLVAGADALFDETLGPPFRFPRHPLLLARFAWRGLRSAWGLARAWFTGELARGFFAGMAGHSVLPLDYPTSAAIGLMLPLAGHAAGWPLPRGGSQQITNVLASYLRSLGGEIVTGFRVAALEQLPAARAVFFDTGPHQLSRIAADHLPHGFRRKLERFRYGPAVFKLDWALAGPIPWKTADCARAATVHLGGTLEEIAASEKACWQGKHSDRPFVLLAQQSLFDSTRAPAGKHTGWAYCHVPHGSTADMTATIEAQVERFAPGFRDLILARSTLTPADMERKNANYIGGDITGGCMTVGQLFTRPTARLVPYATPNPAIWICSASTPPGAGVHGMCGRNAAEAALAKGLV